MRPCVGLIAATPQCAAGSRTDPAISVPIARGVTPAARVDSCAGAGSTRRLGGVPRIGDDPELGTDSRRQHAEVGHRGLGDDDRAGLPQALHRSGIALPTEAAHHAQRCHANAEDPHSDSCPSPSRARRQADRVRCRLRSVPGSPPQPPCSDRQGRDCVVGRPRCVRGLQRSLGHRDRVKILSRVRSREFRRATVRGSHAVLLHPFTYLLEKRYAYMVRTKLAATIGVLDGTSRGPGTIFGQVPRVIMRR